MGIHFRNEAEETSESIPETNAYTNRSQPGATPLYDDYTSQTCINQIYSVKIARDFEDMAKVIAIRASACFSDPQHLYAKHFDGNDFSATHLIGHVGAEPVASLRIRYFAEFARIERLTVRPTHRRSRIAFRMVKAAFAFCRDKGYRRLSGVAREEMVPFWSLFGGSVSKAKEPIFIYGLPHFEMSIEFPEQASAVSEHSDPLVLLRPEGRWHEAGYHETVNVTPPAIVAAPPVRGTRRPADLAGKLSGHAMRSRLPKAPLAGPQEAVADALPASH
jgi:GNAT superfamily N-acetyltransferase